MGFVVLQYYSIMINKAFILITMLYENCSFEFVSDRFSSDDILYQKLF